MNEIFPFWKWAKLTYYLNKLKATYYEPIPLSESHPPPLSHITNELFDPIQYQSAPFRPNPSSFLERVASSGVSVIDLERWSTNSNRFSFIDIPSGGLKLLLTPFPHSQGNS